MSGYEALTSGLVYCVFPHCLASCLSCFFFFFNFESLAFCRRPSEQRVQVALGIDAQKRRRIRGAAFPLTTLQQLLGDALTHASTSGGQRSDSE